MKRKTFNQWLAALRSGEWEQWNGGLWNGFEVLDDSQANSYCCLGVLARMQWNNNSDEVRGSDEAQYRFQRLMTGNYLEHAPVEKCGFDMMDADMQKHVATLNDADFPFTFIADFMERHTGKDDDEGNVRFNIGPVTTDILNLLRTYNQEKVVSEYDTINAQVRERIMEKWKNSSSQQS